MVITGTIICKSFWLAMLSLMSQLFIPTKQVEMG